MKWRFATLNTWKNDGNYHKRLQLIETQAQELSADFLFLQEVFSTLDGDIHTANTVAQKLHQKAYTQSARIKLRKLDEKQYLSSSGLAVISAKQFAEQGAIILPSCEQDGGRKAQYTSTRLNQNIIKIVNLHLSHLPNNDELKIRQLQAVLSHPAIASASHLMLIGDFNSTPGSITYRFLQEQQFVSSFKALKKDYVPTLLSTSQKPNRTLDYIMLRSNSLMFSNTGITFNNPNPEGLYPSDHLGVWADIIPKELTT